MSDAERDEFEFEPIEDLPDAETPDEEPGEVLEPLDEADLDSAFEPLDEPDLTGEGDEIAPADEAEAAEEIEEIEPAEEADMVESAEESDEEGALPMEEGLAGAAFAAEGEPEEAFGEEPEEEKPGKKKGKLLESILSASPFTVLLIIAFAALLMGTLCLMLELKSYDFDIKAEKARRANVTSSPLYSPALSRTLAACPMREKLDFNSSGELA